MSSPVSALGGTLRWRKTRYRLFARAGSLCPTCAFDTATADDFPAALLPSVDWPGDRSLPWLMSAVLCALDSKSLSRCARLPSMPPLKFVVVPLP